MRNDIELDSQVLSSLIKELFLYRSKVKYIASGNSMRPFYRSDKDYLELESANFHKVRVGDAILVNVENGRLILHRLVKKNDDSFFILGDAHLAYEGPYEPNQIIAKVTGVWKDEYYISTSAFWYKTLIFAWMSLLPIRPQLFKVGSMIKRRFT